MVCFRYIIVNTLHKGDNKDNNNNNNENNNNYYFYLKSLRRYLSNRTGSQEIKELQKNSHIGHCTRTAGSADVKVQGRNNITCSKNCKYRTVATSHTLQTWFVSGI